MHKPPNSERRLGGMIRATPGTRGGSASFTGGQVGP